jgi:hypothetical protein
MVLLLVLLVPSGIVFAGSVGQVPLQTGTQTALPNIAPTPVVEQTPVSSSFTSFQIPGLLQTNIKTQISDGTDTFTFEQFGLSEKTMTGPFATSGYYFDLPLTWKMKQGASLQLVLDTYYTGATSTTSSTLPASNPISNYIGTIQIQYNYTTIGTINLVTDGRTQVDIPIPLDVINRAANNRGHSIQLILDSSVNCNTNFSTTVIIRSISQLYMPHDLIDPPIDLRLLPAPFSQNSFNQDMTFIVVPNQPTVEELQAALSISAGFGRMTFNGLLISLIPVNQATADVLASTNLIFVGKAKGLPLLKQILLPVPVSNDSFVAKDALPTDGIIQMAISPWNKSKVLMVVGGNDDQAIVKAANAISSGMLQVGSNPSLSLVSNVQLTTPMSNPTDVNRTFADLGYDSFVASQVGLNVLQYSFNIPQSYTIGPDAYLDLNFSHTSLLEYQRSTIVVNLNGQPVGSVRLSDETVGQGNAKVFLPASAARPGNNNLSLEITLEPRNECVNPLLNGLWMRIDSSSSLHLPFVPNLANTSTLIDLSRYPFPFAFDPLMKDLAFVLSENDPIGWNVAAQIASQLGNAGRIQVAGLETFYADSVPDVARQDRNLIIIGKPSKLDILSELHNFLPASFEPGTDLASEKNLQISYNLGAGVDVGYLELLSTPWNLKQTILYVGGSSDLGVRWAGAALQFGRLRGKLNGNLAFINGEQVVTSNTMVLQASQNVSATAISVDVTPGVDPQLQQVAAERPVWIVPTIFTTLGGIILLLIILGVQATLRKRSGK